jgi:hypothetical protein
MTSLFVACGACTMQLPQPPNTAAAAAGSSSVQPPAISRSNAVPAGAGLTSEKAEQLR